MCCLNALSNEMHRILYVAPMLFLHYDLKLMNTPQSEKPLPNWETGTNREAHGYDIIRVIRVTILVRGFASSTILSSTVEDNYKNLVLIISNKPKYFQMEVPKAKSNHMGSVT